MVNDDDARRIASGLLDVPADQLTITVHERHWMATTSGCEDVAVVAPDDGVAWRCPATLAPRERLRAAPDWTSFLQFVRGLPACVWPLVRNWPPLTVVMTKPGVELLIPAPGVEGRIGGWYEDGSVGVVAPITLPHPRHGWGPGGRSAMEGQLATATIAPELLLWTRAGRWTRLDVDEALNS